MTAETPARWTYHAGVLEVVCPEGHVVPKVPPWAGKCRCEACAMDYEVTS